MQRIPDLLTESIKNLDGEILFRKKVKRIILEKGVAAGVELEDGNIYYSKCVVSNSDLKHTFFSLLDLKETYPEFYRKLESYIPSYSIFIHYLLLNKSLRHMLNVAPGIWFVPIRRSAEELETDNINMGPNIGMFCSISSKLDESLMPNNHDIVRLLICSKYKNEDYWRVNSKNIERNMVDQLRKMIPSIDNLIECSGRATSKTMQNYTYNNNGSVSGWMNTVYQVNNPIINFLPDIPNLYFTGHWIPNLYGNGGVGMVAESGHNCAKKIIYNFD
jgi:prolycopene isomerase